MIRFIFRVLSTIALAVAVIMAVIDATRSVAANRLVVTPLLKSWSDAAPATMELSRTAIEGHAPAFVWDTLIMSILSLPGFVVFSILAFLLYAIGHRPRRRTQRFQGVRR